MENKEDLLESISSVTKNLEAGLELNNKSSVSQYYCDALNDKNINDVLGDADTHLIGCPVRCSEKQMLKSPDKLLI